MGRLGPVAAILALLALFLVANRGAYQSTFSDDDLDNIAWTHASDPETFPKGLLSPFYYPNHFRPVGHGSYRLLFNAAGLDFRPYVAAIHLLHLANSILLWLLLRRLGVGGWHAFAGVVFFGFNMTLFDALWKPMYVFDLWCALFCLAALIFYIDGRTVLALVAFWLAYKSKEHAVALPAVLFAYEWLLGRREWKRPAPFAAIAVWFAGQGLFMNRHAQEDYTLHFTPAALWTTLSFYGPRLLPLPVLLLLPWRRPTRRVWFGFAATVLLIGPMLFLPTRLSGAYLYVAMVGVGIAVASALEALPWWAAAAFFALWIPLNYQQMREERRTALTAAHENRAYLTAAARLPAEAPGIRHFVYDGFPPGLHWWGIRGALRIFYHRDDIEISSVEDGKLKALFEQGDVALLTWDNPRRRLSVVKRSPGEPPRSFIEMDETTPIWQLDEGWYQAEPRYRWIKPRATAHLYRPAEVNMFQVSVNIGPRFIADVKRSQLIVRIDGQQIGSAEFDSPGWRTLRFPLAGVRTEPGTVQVEFIAQPEYRPSAIDPRVLGIPIGAFGFVQEKP